MINLKNTIEKHPECLENWEKFKNFMMDLYPEIGDRIQIKVLTDVFRSGIVDEIKNGKDKYIDYSRYSVKMQQDFGYSFALIKSSINMWMNALGRNEVSENLLDNDNNYFEIDKTLIDEEHEHQYKKIVISGTCQKGGYTIHRCKCGYEYRDTFTGVTDHNFEVVEKIDATCNSEGRVEYICSYCSEYKTETISPNDHKFGKWIEKTHASCEESGLLFRKCELCGTIEEKIEEATGHNWGKWDNNSSNEYECRMCSNCGAVEKREKMDYSMYPEFIIENRTLKKYKGTKPYVTIPNGIEIIGECAFCYNENIQSIRMPESVEAIEESAFLLCKNLSQVVFSSNIKSIPNYAFWGCWSLNFVKIPEGIESIGDGAFGTRYIKVRFFEICIPNSVKTIGKEIFEGRGRIKIHKKATNEHIHYYFSKLSYSDKYNKYNISIKDDYETV